MACSTEEDQGTMTEHQQSAFQQLMAEARGGRMSRLTLWVAWLAYAFWKHGWVRADPFHVKMFLGSIAILALVLEVLPGRHTLTQYLARGFGVVACVLAISSIESLYLPSLSKSLVEPARAFRDHARTLCNPAGYFARMRETLAANRARAGDVASLVEFVTFGMRGHEVASGTGIW